MKIVRRIDPTAQAPNNDDVGQLIAERVRDWRKNHNAEGKPRAPKERPISQLRMAELADVSVGCLQGVETATRKTKDVRLAKIAALMGCTLEELKSGDSPDDVHVVPDPRGKGLNDEDYEVAHWFHDAHTDVKVSVRNTLEAHARQREGRAPLRREAEAHPDDRDLRALIDGWTQLTAAQKTFVLSSYLFFQKKVSALGDDTGGVDAPVAADPKVRGPQR